MANAVFCIASDMTQATRIVNDLKVAGFGGSDISVLFPDREGTADFAHEQGTKAPEGAVAGGTTGGVIGGVIGLLAGIGALAIPGVGPLIAVGPILATLSGGAVGAAVGGLAGALVGLGIPEYEAKLYEGKIRDGNILIAAHTEDRDKLRDAKRLVEAAGATHVTTGSSKRPPTDTDNHRPTRS